MEKLSKRARRKEATSIQNEARKREIRRLKARFEKRFKVMEYRIFELQVSVRILAKKAGVKVRAI